MSTFDPAVFEQMTIDQANETESTPIPEGDYQGIIDSQAITGITLNRGERAGQVVPILRVTYELDVPEEVKKELNRDKVLARQDIWLDVTENGSLSFGPNTNLGLGRLRDAVGLNKPGVPFSFGMLEGQGPVMVHISHRHTDDGRTFEQVRISKMGS